MRTFRLGMTLFELLIVIMIVGIVYSLGMFTVKKERIASTTLPLSGIKTSLTATEHSGLIRLVCDKACRDCRILDAKQSPIGYLRLQSESTPQRYGFDRYGELRPIGPAVVRTEKGLEQACFEFTLFPDGTSTPLILKDNASYYAYTPLTDQSPYITGDTDALRRFLFDERRYPMKADDFYGQH